MKMGGFGMSHNAMKEEINLYENPHMTGRKNPLKAKNLIPNSRIIDKEKKRLGVKNPKITLHDMGLDEIKSEGSLYNLIQANKIKVTKLESNSLNQVKIRLKSTSSAPSLCKINAGTLIFPDEPMAENTQTLIVRDDLSTQVSENGSDLELSTFCFNKELRAPGTEPFFLGAMMSTQYTKGMNQDEVWNITNTQREKIKELEEKYSKDVKPVLGKPMVVKKPAPKK